MFIWENYLTFRQYLVEQKNLTLPSDLHSIIDKETFTKARFYAIDKSKFSFISSVYGHAEGMLILTYGGIPFIWNLCGRQLSGLESEWMRTEISQSALFLLYSMIFSLFTSLPMKIYSTFVIEERHGFNKQSFGFFIKDTIKKFMVSLVLTLPTVSLLIYIIQAGGDYFFIYAWIFVTLFSLFLITIYADFIAPLFDKYTVLPEGDLRTKIEAMAKSLNFPLYKLYVVEGSKRSVHSNAYFYGFFKSKRIVLFDTLIEGYVSADAKKDELEKKEETQAPEPSAQINEEKKESKKGCSNEEILAVLAHELGHWKLNHNLKNLILSEINTFYYFVIFAALMNRQVFYAAFGFEDIRPTLIGLIVIIQFLFAPYNELLSFFMISLSRRFEFQADEFAKKMQKAEYLKAALIKLSKDNLSFPLSDWLYSTWHFSHPPLIERLRALDEKDKTE